jgi:hypothetical protein
MESHICLMASRGQKSRRRRTSAATGSPASDLQSMCDNGRMFKALATAFLCLTLLLCAGCQRTASLSAAAAANPNQYYAVLLTNGSVYFGHLEGLGSSYPVLRDVYYVQTATNPETKAVSSVLVKRGKEWHGPDRMVINETSIVFVEPVGADSKVAQLIAESKK